MQELLQVMGQLHSTRTGQANAIMRYILSQPKDERIGLWVQVFGLWGTVVQKEGGIQTEDDQTSITPDEFHEVSQRHADRVAEFKSHVYQMRHRPVIDVVQGFLNLTRELDWNDQLVVFAMVFSDWRDINIVPYVPSPTHLTDIEAVSAVAEQQWPHALAILHAPTLDTQQTEYRIAEFLHTVHQEHGAEVAAAILAKLFEKYAASKLPTLLVALQFPAEILQSLPSCHNLFAQQSMAQMYSLYLEGNPLAVAWVEQDCDCLAHHVIREMLSDTPTDEG